MKPPLRIPPANRHYWGEGGRFVFSPAVQITSTTAGGRVKLVNDTMVAHPIHLHGHFFELGGGAGLDSAEAGLRLHYEFTREFAPDVGIEQEWKAGGSADYARAAGEDPSVTNYVVDLHFWF